MNRGLYTAATGMSAMQRMLDVTANNLANASTNGFKSDGLIFKDAFEANLNNNGQPIGQLSYGVMASGGFTNFQVGSISQTGNPLDVAITDPKGAFKVQTPGGQDYFTRDGAFRLNDQKQLVDNSGDLVLDSSSNPITLDGQTINIKQNGDIDVDGQTVATLGVFAGTFEKLGQNQFKSNDAKPVDSITVQSRAIEGSNVNPVEAMIQMITLSRSFDMAQKAVQQHDQLTQRLIQSLSGP
ncbi:MAG: flagellar hook-basal body protein [Fimbriimonadales bacterium]